LAVFRPIATSILLSAVTCQPLAAQTAVVPYRDEIVQRLHQLLATGFPLDNEHDDGEWLQVAVNYAIRLGDRQIEHLAMRAAVPLRARVARPVSSTAAPTAIEVASYLVLRLPRAIPYVAWIESSLDAGPFIPLDTQASGTLRTVDLARLGTGALRPGTHIVRLRARLVFGNPQQPVHSEVREFAPVGYALYDDLHGSPVDARRFIYSPASLAASDLDPLLPAEPVLQWLGRVLSSPDRVADARMWTSRYCSELKDEHRSAHTGGICTVIPFVAGSSLGQIWVRTGHVEDADTGIVWFHSRPSVEAVFLADGAVSRLAALPGLLDRPVGHTGGELTLSAADIVITPTAPRPGVPVKAVITLHNHGDTAVQNVLLEVVHADGLTEGTLRRFLIDIPAFGSQSVSVEVSFRSGYGLVVALPFVRGHGLSHDVLVGPPLEGLCAFRPINLAAAPRDYLRTAGDLSGCHSR
jgi:hypothetical protein